MLTMVLWTLLALVAAALVLVVAGVADGPDGADRPLGVRAYLADLRAGLRSLRAERAERAGRAGRAGHPEPGDDVSPRPTAAPVHTSIEDLFTASAEQAPAYLGVDDLTGTLARARDRATRGVTHFARR